MVKPKLGSIGTGKAFQLELAKLFSQLTPGQRQLLGNWAEPKTYSLTLPSMPDGKGYFEVLGDSFYTLAKHGWFVNFCHTPIELSFKSATCFLDPSKISIGDQIMGEHYRTIIDNIQKEAEADFPHRRSILEKAFSAHRNGDYELSIPVMLAQADGIGEEIFGKDISPSSRRPGKVKARENFIANKINPGTIKILGRYFSLVASLLPINANESERINFLSPLNRHLVLHGISTDYASEVNALKTISWLQYIISFKSPT